MTITTQVSRVHMTLDSWNMQLPRWMDIFSDYEPDLKGLELSSEVTDVIITQRSFKISVIYKPLTTVAKHL